ncbi:hypothetical protein [Modestobacter italicus]|uniref:hypothetical protein n=1 Tax=Modestobacter italicus (strain DSM 44449 / CECT 9708 / BC 501) TaxID=2732864 RepID=UPI001C972005|nr:hypothetical protein [Modestobacter italicus]
MSSPRDRNGDGPEDDPAAWQEPAHLGGADPEPAPEGSDRPADDAPAGGSTAAGGWQPPGWDLPAVEPERRGAEPDARPGPDARPAPEPWQPPAVEQRQFDVPPEQAPPRRGLGGLFGSRRPTGAEPGPDGPPAGPPPEQPGGWSPIRRRNEAIPIPPSDPAAMLAWAQHLGWVPSDGTTEEDAALLPLLQSAPVRPGKEDRPSRVLRGRGNGLDLVAFDIASPAGRAWLSTHAVTAAPVLGSVPGFRLSPARIWRHGTGGLLQIPSPDPEFDRRWVLLAAEDGPQVRRLAEDPMVRQSLLGSDDGDELWSAAGYVAAVRPDANRPQLIEHHARLLAAVVGALAVTW